jgi:hypothetical protein
MNFCAYGNEVQDIEKHEDSYNGTYLYVIGNYFFPE